MHTETALVFGLLIGLWFAPILSTYDNKKYVPLLVFGSGLALVRLTIGFWLHIITA